MLKKDAHLVEKGTRGFEELFHPLQGNRKKKHVVSRGTLRNICTVQVKYKSLINIYKLKTARYTR